MGGKIVYPQDVAHRKTFGHYSVIFWLIEVNRAPSDRVKKCEFGNSSIFEIFQEMTESRPNIFLCEPH